MTTETTTESTLNDLAESLNGWEEIAVAKAFGFQIDDFENHGTLGVRAIAFVEFKREGQKDALAHKAAMDMTMRELVDRYPEMAEDKAADPMASIDGGKPGKA